jgi:Domain of unknown function (DUF543)
MASNTTSSVSSIPPPSEKLISLTMQKGFQEIMIDTTTGVVVGMLAGIVLASTRGGGSSSAAVMRKSLTGLGAGIGFGAAWTRTSMNIEDCITSYPSVKKVQ